jgi:hypothetical protein
MANFGTIALTTFADAFIGTAGAIINGLAGIGGPNPDGVNG